MTQNSQVVLKFDIPGLCPPCLVQNYFMITEYSALPDNHYLRDVSDIIRLTDKPKETP